VLVGVLQTAREKCLVNSCSSREVNVQVTFGPYNNRTGRKGHMKSEPAAVFILLLCHCFCIIAVYECHIMTDISKVAVLVSLSLFHSDCRPILLFDLSFF
jgi:hypothetical protein